jgi:hypothetical protein
VCIIMFMTSQNTIKRMSLYIPSELADKVLQSAKIHRRSFNQEMLWLAEQGLAKNENAPDQVAAQSGAVKGLQAFSEIKGQL